MNLPRPALLLAVALTQFFSPGSIARAATFTSDTSIGINNTNFDGQDIVVIGCTLTVDGSHAFSDVLLIDNATLTHSYSSNGLLTNTVQVTGELQTLNGTNYSTLDQAYAEMLVVTDLTNGVTYSGLTDYITSRDAKGVTQIARQPGSTIPDGATVAVSYTSVFRANAGLNLVVTNNLVIEAGSAIITDGFGFSGTNGPGPGSYVTNNSPFYSFSGSGGSHGGYGGSSLGHAQGGAAYDSFLTPTNAGSGGGVGTGIGAGGGAVKLVVFGALQVDGQITANGSSGSSRGSGGGSGGGIWLSAGDFGGTGSISANGGAGEASYGGGGGGGRIAVYWSVSEFEGSLSAHGGSGFVAGGAGSIYTQSGNSSGQLVLDNGGLSGTNTPLSQLSSVSLTITNGAAAVAMWESSQQIQIQNLLIASNSLLTVPPQFSLQLSVSSNATIQPGGAIVVDALGGPPGGGLGSGGSSYTNGFYTGGGGGHGGHGAAGAFGAAGGNANDLPLNPAQTGSGGGAGNGSFPYNLGGAGGGIVRLNVQGALLLGGTISANGGVGIGEGSGGGAGGAVWLNASTISGGGTISACGGAGQAPYGGGGGGGCIAMYSGTSTFTGALAASGGGGVNRGGAGTIYTQLAGAVAPQLILDNGGIRGTNTPLPSATGFDLTISGGAVAALANSQSFTCHNLLIGAGSLLTVSTGSPSALTLNVSANATIQAGGAITLDGQGYGSGLGIGSGGMYLTNGFYVGGGAGHGGLGGSIVSSVNQAGGGGGTYDTAITPDLAGSGGGRGIGLSGGSGGGALILHVTGNLVVAGSITANGTGGGEDCGGGSGGAISLIAGGFSGGGTIAANGGSGGLPLGGGGGGGRIGIAAITNTFTGNLSVHGGTGGFSGGAGTIYIQSPLSAFGQLVIDNGGVSGTYTPLPIFSGTYDLTITNGATILANTTIPSIRNLLIAPNSFLSISGYVGIVRLSVSGNATLAAGGGIVLDGKGYPGGQGPGAGLTFQANGILTGGGAGHGGSGGAGATGAAGGSPYDNFLQPAQAGSGGGAGAGSSQLNPGGAGGGGVNFSVTGTLLLAGSITANGNAGIGQGSGGGAGGSIQITAGKLSGTGTIAANGGAGESSMGGGGGAGGYIAISETAFTFPTNPPFAGTISAHGGPGFVAGGAGIIYTRLTLQKSPQLVLDNGGMSGAGTQIPQSLGAQGSQGADISITGGTMALLSGGQRLSADSLLIGSNSFLSIRTLPLPLAIQLGASSVTIQAGGGIKLDGLGYAANTGPGAGRLGQSVYGPVGSGGGYGGYGGGNAAGTPGGGSYDGFSAPSNFGSGGGSETTTNGGAGGGSVQITVTGALALDGTISANGTTSIYEGSGGGSGGCISLSAGLFSGSGSISANGGAGSLPEGGGGGGGRIALYFNTNHFTGTISAVGGAGFVGGGAGTIYTQLPLSGAFSTSQIIVDNGGLTGTNTPISTPEAVPTFYIPPSLMISGGANVQPLSGQPLSFSSLRVAGGSALTQPGTQGSLKVYVSGDALIDTNGLISADGQGYTGLDGGPGAGTMLASGSGSGAGYGGAGGASASGIPGGLTNGSSFMPTNFGSRGGLYPTSLNLCQGGGAVFLQVGGALTVNGTVTANGNAALYEGAGGGSGGSIFLTTRTFGGSGTITANGGAGELSGGGGGGGGGRIAAYYRTNNFTGLMTALGAAGAVAGQNGTVYLSNGVPVLQFITGTVADGHGLPVAGVSLQASGGLPATITDSNGNYSLPVSLGWSGAITPVQPGAVFLPGSLSYTAVTQTLSGQNYLVLPPSMLGMTGVLQGAGLNLSWFGATGANYQVQYSTDLINWLPYGAPIAGTNGPITFAAPPGTGPQMFYRFGVIQ